MAQREGSVFVYLFVATLVLIVALVSAVLVLKADRDDQMQRHSNLQETAAKNEEVTKKYLEEIRELKALVAGSAEDFPDVKYFKDRLADVEEKMNAVRKSIDENAGNTSYSFLTEPYDDYRNVLESMRQAWEKELVRSSSAFDSYEKLQGTTQNQLKELDGINEGLKTQLSDLEKKYEDNDTSLRQRIEELTNENAEQEEEATRNELEAKKQIAFRDNRIQQLLNRIERCEREKIVEKTIEDIEPDGQLLDVESRSQTVWVNLGRKNHVRPGLVFRVFQYVGGKKHWKGSVEIRRVEDDFSEGRITETVDPLNPLATNDYVTSPFYDPKATPTFVFAGTNVTSPRVTLGYIKRRLEGFGAKIGDSVKIDTDFLVALENYEGTPEYSTARELGVTILREADLIDYLGR